MVLMRQWVHVERDGISWPDDLADGMIEPTHLEREGTDEHWHAEARHSRR
jgi:S-adenosylmethionine synthetase